jgi:hypothetical protein
VLQLVFVLVEEFFVSETLQVLIMNVIVVETLRAQIKRIVNMLTSVLVSKVARLEGTAGGGQTGLGGGTNKLVQGQGFSVAQHMSAACRVARNPILSNLVASKVLQQLSDNDVAACRGARSSRIGFWTKILITVPTVLALTHESVQQCFLDVLIPTMWCCFVLGNVHLYNISLVLMVVPYVLLLLLALYRYGYLRPKKKRRRQYDQTVLDQHRDTEMLAGWSSAFSFIGSEQRQDSEENMWRNMNLSLSLNAKDDVVPSTNFPGSVAVAAGEHKSRDPCKQSVPPEISAQRVQPAARDRHLYDKQHSQEGSTRLQLAVNRHLWKVGSSNFSSSWECSSSGSSSDSSSWSSFSSISDDSSTGSFSGSIASTQNQTQTQPQSLALFSASEKGAAPLSDMWNVIFRRVSSGVQHSEPWGISAGVGDGMVVGWAKEEVQWLAAMREAKRDIARSSERATAPHRTAHTSK